MQLLLFMLFSLRYFNFHAILILLPLFRYSFHSPFSGPDLIGRILLDFAQVTLNPSSTTARERMAAILADQRQRLGRLIWRHAPLNLHARNRHESLSINKSQCAVGDCFVVNPSRRLLTQPAFSTFSLCLFRRINTSALFFLAQSGNYSRR